MVPLLRLLVLLAAASTVRKASAQASNSSCVVEVTLSPGWTNPKDNSTIVSVNVNIINKAPVAVAVPWVLTLSNKYYGAVQQTFNLQYLNGTTGSLSGQATNFFQTLVPGGVASAGIILTVTNGTGLPTSASLNTESCTVTTAPPSLPPPASTGSAEEGGQLTTSNGQIIGLNGQPLQLNGLNYFGFDDGNTMVDGLWVGSESITQDFATIVYRQQLLGFNAVRLPFSFVSLFDTTPKTQTYQCTTDPASVIVASTIAPGASSSGTAPPQTAPPSNVPGVCNSYLPEDTTLNRFLFVVNFYASNGFYIILDNQFNLDQTAINNQQQWIQRWTSLMTQLTNTFPNAAARCLVDMLNEPDAFKLQWQAQSGLPGVGDLYLAAMDAIYPVNQGVLFLIEGAGQSGLALNWGDGIAADPAIIQSYGISDTNPFFTALLKKPYLNQVVAAPHVYPPSISKATTSTTGAALFKRLSESFGYLNKQGYCSGSNTVGAGTGNCHLFPVIIGETGSAFSGTLDTQPMADFATWCNNQGAAADGLHNAVSGVFWWAWNANSGDTGGFVTDDWQTIRWDKIAWMQSVGLQPWYAPQSPTSSSPPTTSPGSSNVVVSAPPPSSPPPTVASVPPPPVAFSSNPSSSGSSPPPPTPPGCSAPATPSPTPPTAGPSGGTGAIESASTQLQALTTSEGVIYGVDGGELAISGVTWYGFDNGTSLFGLEGDESVSVDFSTQLQRIIALGFNTIELPFSFKGLQAGAPSKIPTDCFVTPYDQILDDTNPPSITLPYGTKFPNLTTTPSITNNTCNTYVPSDSTLNRFVYIVNFITANGLYVRLDNRLDIDNSAVENPQSWINSWSSLITTLSQDENTRARLMVSPLTNPDIGGMRWNPAYGVAGASNLYIQLMDALFDINQDMLFLIQGPGQVNLTGVGGSSYVTNIPNAFIADNRDSDPNSFFKQVLVKPYVSQVVISPRVLAPSLAQTSNSSSGSDLYNRLSTSFGYLNKQGFCVNTQCKVFPLAVSGFGSPFATAQDSGFESDLASWLTNANIANDGLHNAVTSFFWNGWDPESYGPILKTDGIALDYTILDYLSTLGLSPWYFAPTVHRSAPAIPLSYANTTVSNDSFCQATTSVSLSGNSRGATGGTFLGSIAVTLINTGDVAISPPWQLTLLGDNYQGISQAFGLTQTQVLGVGVSGVATDTFNILWPQSTNQVTVGFVVVSSSNSFAPEQVQLNGQNCTLSKGSSAASSSAPASLTGGSIGGAESVESSVISLSSNTLTGTTALAAISNDGNSR